jgi:hypothetical protein
MMWKKLKCDAEASFGCSLASNLTEGKTKESDGFDYCSGAGTKLATLTTLARHSHKRKKIKNMRNANVEIVIFHT